MGIKTTSIILVVRFIGEIVEIYSTNNAYFRMKCFRHDVKNWQKKLAFNPLIDDYARNFER